MNYKNEQAVGRNLRSADFVELHTFGPSCTFGPSSTRMELHWNDGGFAYEVFDTREEAIQNAARLGFAN